LYYTTERQTGKYFGGVQVGKLGIISSMDQINTIPLLLSVRSGAAVSMPGNIYYRTLMP